MGKGGTKVATSKKKEVIVKTTYFAFTESTAVIDLAAGPLKIKQVTLFTPKDKDSEDVTLEIWEIQGNKKEAKPYPIVKIVGKVDKADGFNFRVASIEQDGGKFPKPKNSRGTALWMEAEVEVVGTDGKKRGLGESAKLTFVLPPLEYDETLELQLGANLPGSVAGNAKVTFSTFNAMMGANKPEDKTAGVPAGGKQIDIGGNLKNVVLHSMCAVAKAYSGDTPSTKCFDADTNLKIFKDNGVSAHFLIGRKGEITQAVNHTQVAHHAYSPSNVHLKAANSLSIGIELFGFADDFRESLEEELAKEKKNKLRKEKADLEAALEKRKKQKAEGVTEITVGKEKMTIDEAISRIEAAIKAKGEEIAKAPLSARAQDFETMLAPKRPDGVPHAFAYTDQQYAALGALMEVFARRYGYGLVCSHHYIIPFKKKDPGKHFDWDRLKPFLLPGALVGDEAGDGGVYTVTK